MEQVDVSPQFKATSLSVPSPNATHIACLTGARLHIRCLASFEIIRSIPLPSAHNLRASRICWSPPTSPSRTGISTPPRRSPPPSSHRVLVADDEAVRVYDLRDEKWNAHITNGSGGMGKIVHVEFGRTEEEVLVWSDFTSKITVWCLRTGRTVELKDPKFLGKAGRGWGYRPILASDGTVSRGRVLAMLCRSAGQDILLLLASKTYATLKRLELSTVDAQDLKWSKDGKWIAIWDAASTGYNLHIYTADGHTYRTIHREPSDELSEWAVEGLGIKNVEWVPGNEWLAVGGWDRRVRILSTKTFAPVLYLDHTAQICIPSIPVYTEHVEGRRARRYENTQQPAMPPKAPVVKNETGLMKQGIGMMAFNSEGFLCATRDDSAPTTVWIWDLRSLKPKTILIQHAQVRSLQWHPHNPSLLLIQTTTETPTLYLYTAQNISSSSTTSSSTSTPSPPQILDLQSHVTKPAGSLPAKWTPQWLATSPNKKPLFIMSHQQGYILVWPHGKDQILRFEHQEESDDSLYDILTGRTPVPPLNGSGGGGGGGGKASHQHRHGGYEIGEEMEEDEYSGGFVDLGDADGDGVYEESVGMESTGNVEFEDTFRERRMRGGFNGGGGDKGGGRGRSVFDESGLDEMF